MKSAAAQKFVRGQTTHDSASLYRSMLEVAEKGVTGKNNEDLKLITSNYIYHNKNLHNSVLNSDTQYRKVQDYCDAIVLGKRLADEIQLVALSDLFGITICLISTQNNDGISLVCALCFGDEDPQRTNIVFIYYDAKEHHFDPLYLIREDNPAEKQTIFSANDDVARELLRRFIREEIGYDGYVKLPSINHVTAEEELATWSDLSDYKSLSNLIVENRPSKRKREGIEDLALQDTDRWLTRMEVPETFFATNQPISLAETARDETSAANNNVTRMDIIDAVILFDGAMALHDGTKNNQ